MWYHESPFKFKKANSYRTGYKLSTPKEMHKHIQFEIFSFIASCEQAPLS